MKSSQLKMAFGAATILGIASTGAIAQTAEPTYKGDPSVYKLIFEDANFRVIEATRKAGVHDKAHGHPSQQSFISSPTARPRHTPQMARQPKRWGRLERQEPFP